MSKEIVKSITDTLGSEAIQARLGVTEFSIRHARREGSFTASWYVPLKEMCETAGIECPQEVFNWKATISEAS